MHCRAIDPGATDSPAHDGEQRISLGTDAGRTLTLVYRAADTPDRSLLVADIARIARDAVAVERMRREETERAAIWPATEHGDKEAIYTDDQMISLVAAAKRVAPINVPILITGAMHPQ